MKRAQARADVATVVDIRSPPSCRISDPTKPFSVECRKSNGLWILFSRYASLQDAISIRDRLAEVGCPARVVECTHDEPQTKAPGCNRGPAHSRKGLAMREANLTARLRAVQRRSKQPDDDDGDDDAIAIEGYRPIVPDGTYDAKYLGHDTMLLFKQPVFLRFEIVQQGEFFDQGIWLPRPYRDDASPSRSAPMASLCSMAVAISTACWCACST